MKLHTTSGSRTRPHLGRVRRVALAAAAVAVGAVVLSGCVVIQSESAQQANVIGSSVTLTTTLCASNAAAAAPCNSLGNSGKPAADAPGQLLLGYRIPAGVTAPPTITTTVPSTDDNGSPITVTLTFTQDAGYTNGLNGLLPPPAGTQWVGYVSELQSYKTSGPQTLALSPTFGLPPGFAGPFNWRTVVGYRAKVFSDQGLPVTCPGPFPGVSYVNPALTSQPTVCVDSPDLGTINGPSNSLATGNLSITPPGTPTVSAGTLATLSFAALFSGDNPTAGAFTTAVSTTLPGVTPTVTPSTFIPGSNSQTNVAVSFTVPSGTAPGTYDVSLSASVAGQSRGPATAHVTVVPAKAATAGAKAAKLTSKLKTTTLKVARKTGIPLTLTLSRKSAISVISLQAKPKVSVTIKKTLNAGKKTIVLIKSKKFHKGKVTITFKGGGVTRVFITTLK